MQREETCGHCVKINNLYPERNTKFQHSISVCPKLIGTVCYNCKQRGHTPKYCKVPKQICVLCRQIGHSESNCGYKMQIISTKIVPLDSTIFSLPDGIEHVDWSTLPDQN